LQAGGSVERLSDGLPGWNSQFAQLTYGGVEDHRYFVRGARDERFGRSDAQLSLGADWQLPQDWFAGISVASSSSPDFMPRSQFELRTGRPIAKGWVVGAGYRRRNYPADHVDSYTATVERYFGDFRAAWTLSLSDLNSGTRSFGQAFTVNWYPSDALSLGTSVSFGDEAEAVGPGQVLKSRVKGFALTGRYSLNARIGLDCWLGVHEQGDFYRRQYAGLAVSVAI
jgi:YaiO family outer membrane protein